MAASQASGSINHSAVTDALNNSPTGTNALDQIEVKKRPHSEVTLTPNKKSDKPTKLHRKNPTKSTESEHSELSDIEELNQSSEEEEIFTPPNKMAEDDQPKVQIDEAQFSKLFLNLMGTPAYKEKMVLLTNEKLDELSDDVKTLKAKLKAKDAQIEALQANDGMLEDRQDLLDQKLRQKNIRISGDDELDGKEDVNKTVMKILGKLKCNVNPKEIENAYRLGQKEVGKKRTILVEFNSVRTKRHVFKARTLLKSKYKEDVWMSDDLTPRRSNLLYNCRQLKKAKLIFEYWSYDCEIFLKTTETGDAKKMRNVEDLHQYIPPGSLLDRPVKLTKLIDTARFLDDDYRENDEEEQPIDEADGTQ